MRKKWICALALMVLVFPVMLFAGCDKTGTAKDVKNEVYYIETAYKDMDVNQEVIDNNLKISFFDEHFKVEYGLDNKSYYAGTYTADKDTVELEISEAGGNFTLENIPSHLKFTRLKYYRSTLSIEFIDKGCVYRYSFVPEEN